MKKTTPAAPSSSKASSAAETEDVDKIIHEAITQAKLFADNTSLLCTVNAKFVSEQILHCKAEYNCVEGNKLIQAMLRALAYNSNRIILRLDFCKSLQFPKKPVIVKKEKRSCQYKYGITTKFFTNEQYVDGVVKKKSEPQYGREIYEVSANSRRPWNSSKMASMQMSITHEETKEEIFTMVFTAKSPTAPYNPEKKKAMSIPASESAPAPTPAVTATSSTPSTSTPSTSTALLANSLQNAQAGGSIDVPLVISALAHTVNNVLSNQTPQATAQVGQGAPSLSAPTPQQPPVSAEKENPISPRSEEDGLISIFGAMQPGTELVVYFNRSNNKIFKGLSTYQLMLNGVPLKAISHQMCIVATLPETIATGPSTVQINTPTFCETRVITIKPALHQLPSPPVEQPVPPVVSPYNFVFGAPSVASSSNSSAPISKPKQGRKRLKQENVLEEPSSKRQRIVSPQPSIDLNRSGSDDEDEEDIVEIDAEAFKVKKEKKLI